MKYSNCYGTTPIKPIIERLLALKHQQEWLDNYYNKGALKSSGR